MELNPNAEMWKPPSKQGSPRPSTFSPRRAFSPRSSFCHEDPQMERVYNRPMAPERLSQKKFVSKPAPQPATISTINIGVEDFPSPHSSEDAGHYSSSQRPPRRAGGSVHFSMPAASKASPRHTVQINKTSPASKAGTGNGPARDSSAVLSSIASGGKKFGLGNNLLRPLHRDISASEAQSRQATPVLGQKQRPSTAGAICEKASEGKGNAFERHSSCELRDHAGEDVKSPLSQKRFFSRSSSDPLQIPSRQERSSEFGLSMRDMSESLSKIEELIFPLKAGEEVVMRENMAFEASPILSSSFPELEDGSIMPQYVSPFARSQSRNSDGDLEKAEDAIVSGVRKQRRAQSAVKGRRRKDRSMPCHEKSQSCDNEITFQEEVNQRWSLMRSSAEFSSTSLPLYGDRSDSESGASTEEGGDEPSARRRWPKIPQFFSKPTVRGRSASKSESSFFETESTTTQVEIETDALAEQSDTSGRPIGRPMSKIGKSRRSRLEDSNLAGDRTTTGHESVGNAESGEEGDLKHHDLVFNEKRNDGSEEVNEVLCKGGYTRIEQEYGDDGGCMAREPAKELEGSSSEYSTPRKDTTVIVLPTSSVSYGQTTIQATTQVEQRAPQQQSDSTQVLFPTKEAQEQRMDQLSNSVRSSAETLEQEMSREEDHDVAELRSLSGEEVSASSPHTKNQIHGQSSDKVLPHKHLTFYFEDSSTDSESADEKHVDVDSSGAQHLDDLEPEEPESRDVFDARCEKSRSSSGSLKMCAQKSIDVQDKAPIAIMKGAKAEEKYIHASLSTEKLCSILSYLGQVEQSNLQENLGVPAEKGTPRGACFFSPRGNRSPRAVLEHAEDAVSLTSSSQTAHSGTFHLSGEVGGDSTTADCNPPAIAATTVFDGVRKKVQELKHKISEQEAKIAKLQAENEKLVREREKHMLLEREKYHKQLEDQAAEYKVIIQHHLSVNEKMLWDKEQLSEKCCNLAGILSVAESKFDEKVKQLSEQWSREMKKAKEIWAVGEKQRMKIWQEKKIKDLKETAIRGLEPHLDNLNDKHRQELAKMEARYAEDLQSKLDAQNLDYRRQMCELRDHLQQERDKMLDNERLAAHARMAEVADKFEQQAIQQRMRVATEITAQLERSEAGRREDKQYSQELLARLQKEASEREETLRKQMEKNVEEIAMKKDRQIEQLKSQMIATAQQFQQKINDRVTEGMRDREKELRAKLTKERDEQIELVIEKLESEKEELVTQNKKEVATKVNEMVVEKLEVERELKEYKSKFADLSNAFLLRKAETELELEDSGKKVAALRKDIQNQTRLIEELRDQASQHNTKLRNQEEVFEARLKEEQSRLQQTKSDLNQSNSKANEMRNRKVLLTAQNIMVEELAEVEARVRQAIVKKDVVIANLREQLLSAHRQIKATEYLLQREHNAFISET